MASDPEQATRLKTSLKTPTGSFSQCVAMTQNAINANMAVYVNLCAPELKKIEISHPVGQMSGTLKPGQVELPVDTNNFSTVYYHVTWQSGTVTLWNSDLDDYSAPIDLSGWEFVFAIDIGRINLEPGDPNYDEAKEVLHQPGDYSISRLYLDFNTNKIQNFEKARSSFGSYQFKGDELDSLVMLMLRWGRAGGEMAKPENTTLGFAATTSAPSSVNPPAPSFPPTSLMFQHYPYIAPGASSPQSGLADGGKNMLLYLEMTQNKPFPQERLLNYSGNWVIKDMSGTMCISREIFWDNYLMRVEKPYLLRMFNEVTYGWCNNLWVEYWTTSVKWGATYGLGSGSGLDSSSDFYAWNSVSPTRWEWKKEDHKSTSDGGGAFGSTFEMWTKTENQLSFDPGKNQILITGWTQLQQKLNSAFLGITEGFEGGAKMTWSIAATLDSVNEGGLQISLHIDPSQRSTQFPITSWQDSWPGDVHAGEAAKMAARMAEAINRAPFEQAQQQLSSNLISTARFVLPGGMQLFQSNAVFNNNGDVLFEINYDGVTRNVWNMEDIANPEDETQE